MTGEYIQKEAIAVLSSKLSQLGYNSLPEQVAEDRIKFLSVDGDTREVIVCFLNLDKARSISINQCDYNYTPRPDLLILLTIYMNDVKPVLYLIPSMVFTEPNNIFLNHEQPEMLGHFSTWEIKVFIKAIEALSYYSLDAVTDL